MGRALRGIERTMVQVGGAMGPDVNVAIVAGDLPAAVLRRAVGLLQARYEALRARLVDGRLEVQPMGFPSVEVVAGAWQHFAEAELYRPLRLDRGEAFRVVFAPESGAVVLSVHHAVTDGVSMQVLVADLLALCVDLIEGRASAEHVVPLAPAVLDAAPGGWWHGAVGAVGAAAAPWIVEFEQRGMLGEGAVEGPMNAVCAFAEGSPEGLDRLAAACRAHGVTVGAASMAAVSFAVGRLRSVRTGSLQPVGVEVEVDLRRRGGLPADRVGFHTGAVRADRPSAELDFWSLARSLKSEVETDITRGIPWLAHAIADRLDWSPRSVPGVWAACSNLGRYPHPEVDGPLRLTALYGFNGAVPGGPAVIVWVHGIGGRLTLNAVGSAPTVNRAELERVLADVRALLERPAALTIDACWPVARAA